MVEVRFLLDSNIVSEPSRPEPHPKILAKLDRYQHTSAIAAPAWQELLFGLLRLPPSAKRQQLEEYLRGSVEPFFPILPYDQAAADYHAGERARLAALGLTPPFLDGQIASVASVNRLVLVTSNTSDFEHFEGLYLDDWRA